MTSINELKFYWWLCLHGCDIRNIDFFDVSEFHFHCLFRFPRIKLELRLTKINLYRQGDKDYKYLERHYKSNRWKAAKRISNNRARFPEREYKPPRVIHKYLPVIEYSEDEIDDIPF